MDDAKGFTGDTPGRRHGRVDMRRDVRALIAFGGDWVPILAFGDDLSLSGFSLRALEMLDIGTRVIAAFPGPSGAYEHVVHGRVRHCTCDDSTAWVRIGVEVCDPEEGEDLEAITASIYPETG